MQPPFQTGTRLKAVRVALLGGVLLGIQCCATLPDAEQEMAAPHAQQVEFEGVHGPVSDARSDAILSQLEGRDGASDVLEKHLAFEQALNADSPLVLGNKLTLLQNGPDTYAAMFDAIRGARDHINLETFIFADDVAGSRFTDVLLERQAAGVQVNVIYDSVGSLTTPAAFFDRLRDGGIHVLEFNPVNPLTGNKTEWLLNNRDHRRQLVVDGRTAFVGGINISDKYSSTPWRSRTTKKGNQKTGWRDTHIRIDGPVVAEFQKLFIETWARQQGDTLAERGYFPALTTQGDEIVRAIGSTPRVPGAAGMAGANVAPATIDSPSLLYLTLISAISQAEQEVHLTIAYFAPDPQLLKALTDAARRGVDVKLVLPSYSDSWAIFHLGRSFYTELLHGGVRIHERRGALMHAKTACIDGVWSTIGSTNMDWRSFLHNDEINAVILGRGFAAQMEAMFAEDLEESEEIALAKWKQRPLSDRMKERAARIGAYWL